jgi:hypothetical protein
MMDLILKILLALKMAPKDKELQEIYNRIFGDAMKYTDKFNIQMVAATYIAIAMRLYKTSLTPQEYGMMIETIMETEVKPYFKDKETIH